MIRRVVFASATALALAASGVALSQQRSEPPEARYTIDAGTISGMGAGANPLAMLRGGGGGASHELFLRLGSNRAPSGESEGEHFMPQAAGLGRSVPLVSPAPNAATQVESGIPAMPQGQMPQGRLLLFWGCGEHAPAGQPVVIDFAKMARGEVPPGLFAQGDALADDWDVTPANSRTYGDWPNRRDSKSVPANASLLGAHRIASTYAPEINFTLADDFMPPLQPRTSDMASGAVQLAWAGLPKATGYYAWVMASSPDESGQARDMVWWTSASTQQFGGMLANWLSPAAVARLVSAGTVMPPSQTTCAVPAEVKQAGGPLMMTQLYAYGPQADFAYPPRPADARETWRPEWIARVRFRANATVMHGMPGLGDFGDAGDDADRPASRAPEPAAPTKPKCPGGLRGVGMRAAGLCQ